MKGGVATLVLGILFALMTTVLVVMAFRQIGSPADMAKYKRDSQRIADVLRIVEIIYQKCQASYSQESWKPVPESITDDVFPLGEQEQWKDPLTDRPYRYEKVSKTRYRICVNFEMSSEEFVRRGSKIPDSRWKHSVGEHCMEFKVTDPGGNQWEYETASW